VDVVARGRCCEPVGGRVGERVWLRERVSHLPLFLVELDHFV
jgi:hypothetical protein